MSTRRAPNAEIVYAEMMDAAQFSMRTPTESPFLIAYVHSSVCASILASERSALKEKWTLTRPVDASTRAIDARFYAVSHEFSSNFQALEV